MQAIGVWDIRSRAVAPLFPSVLVIAPGPDGYLVRMKSGGPAGDHIGQGQGDSVTARIGQASWTFVAADLGRTLVVTRAARLFGLLPRRQMVTYQRRNPA